MYLGCHLNMANHELSDTLTYMKLQNMNCLQIMLTSPNNRSCKCKYSMDDLRNYAILFKKEDIKCFVHGKYLYNFCRNTDWQNKSLEVEIRMANAFNADLVIHQGKNLKELELTNDQAKQVFADNLTTILQKTSDCTNKILLENSARQGTEMGYTMIELMLIRRLIPRPYRYRVGFCYDTCHGFASGQYTLQNSDNIKLFRKIVCKTLKFRNLSLIHLNDSKSIFDHHADRHEDIGKGHIWKDKLEILSEFLTLCKNKKICVVTETPCGGDDRIREHKLLMNLVDNVL